MRKKILLIALILIIAVQLTFRLIHYYQEKKLANFNKNIQKIGSSSSEKNKTICKKLFTPECKNALHASIAMIDFYFSNVIKTSLKNSPQTSLLINNPQVPYLKPYFIANILKIPREQVEFFLKDEIKNIESLEDLSIETLQEEFTTLLDLNGENKRKYSQIREDFENNKLKEIKSLINKDLSI